MADAPYRAVEVVAKWLQRRYMLPPGYPWERCSAPTQHVYLDQARDLLAALRAAVDPGDVDQLAEVIRRAFWEEDREDITLADTWAEVHPGTQRSWRNAARAVLAHLAPRLTGTGGQGWRHFRLLEPHIGVPTPGTEHLSPSSGALVEARCATCDDGEAIGLGRRLAAGPVPVTGGNEAVRAAIYRELADEMQSRYYGWDPDVIAESLRERAGGERG